MANLLSMPSVSVGLMGRRNQPQGNDLSFLQQLMQQSQQAAQFDAGDAYFTNPAGRPAGNGVPVLENGAVGYAPPTPGAAPAQRERVSGWRLLDRVLGGQTVTEGLDSERTRLQAQADAPQRAEIAAENERIARALGPQALLALRTNPAALGESVGYGYRPQVVANGAYQSTAATGQVLDNPNEMEFGNKLLSVGRDGVQQLAERGPNFAEQNVAERNRIDALGAGQTTVGNYRIDAQGNTIFQAPDIATLGDGQKRVVDGVVTAENAKPNPATDPAAVQARATALEGTAGNIGIALERSRALADNAGTWNQYNPLARQARIDLDNNLNTIKANLTFDKLNELKSQSPTGASGLGALSNQEGILLASTVAALSVDMSKDELERSFKLIDGLVEKMNQSAKGLRSGAGSNAPAPPPGFVLD